MGQKMAGYDLDRVWDYENGYFLTSHVTRLAKVLAQYELYKKVIGLPGHIVECGVLKGTSLVRLATFREILENPFSRKIIAFDIFGKFPRSGNAEDIRVIEEFEKKAGDGVSAKELERVMTSKSFTNYELIQGDIRTTVPDYVAKYPELRISMLHIDVDIYEPTKTILRSLFDKVVVGGLVVLDDYSVHGGETRAVDEFMRGKQEKLEKLSISHIPTYIRKS